VSATFDRRRCQCRVVEWVLGASAWGWMLVTREACKVHLSPALACQSVASICGAEQQRQKILMPQGSNIEPPFSTIYEYVIAASKDVGRKVWEEA